MTCGGGWGGGEWPIKTPNKDIMYVYCYRGAQARARCGLGNDKLKRSDNVSCRDTPTLTTLL